MSTHAKSYLCKYCQDLKTLRVQYLKMPCADCRSYAKTFSMWLLCQYQLKLDDMSNEIMSVRMISIGMYRWLVDDLKPSLEEKTKLDLSKEFAKAIEMKERYLDVDTL